MNLALNFSETGNYKSMSQKARVVTESWAIENLYCPVCGSHKLVQYAANKPVADFYCSDCSSDFELKSKFSCSSKDIFTAKIVDGAYRTMIERITSQNNPNLLYMQYNAETVTNLLLIPCFFFLPDIIEERPPLKETARRAGWTGCNIKLENVPSIGKISIIYNGIVENAKTVVSKYEKAKPLQINNINARGWLMDVFICVERLGKIFNLSEIYDFENELSRKHENNKNVRPKIRQQLQLLRNKGIIEFLGNGEYRKI